MNQALETATTNGMLEEGTMMNPARWLLRVPVPWVFALAYLIGASLGQWVSLDPFGQTPRVVSQSIDCAVFVLGALIAGWALMIFHRAGTTTVPGQFSNKFVEWGPYRFTRNPMYVGLTLAYLGEAILMRQLWPVLFLAPVLAYVHWTVIPLEQVRLREVFGEEYATYCGRVRRWL